MTHVVPQNLLGNPGGDYIRDQVFAKRGASGVPAMGWSSLVELSALAPPMRVPQIQAGANITITHNALGPVIAGSGGGGLSDGDYGDVTVGGGGTTLTVDNDAITYAKMQDVSATSRVLGRKTAGSGDPEEVTLSELLDFVGSAARGDILYRAASTWARLAAGTSGHFLKTQGAGADPVWAAASGGGSSAGTFVHLGTTTSSAAKQLAGTMPYDSTTPINTDGVAWTEMDVTVTPASASSNLFGFLYVPFFSTTGQPTCVIAAFRDSTTDTIGFWSHSSTGSEFNSGALLMYRVASGSTSSTTFKIRVGYNNGATMNINRVGSSATLYNNKGVAIHSIFEVTP